MIDTTKLNSLYLTSYFFNQEKKIFSLRPSKKQTAQETYNKTAEVIQIVRTLISNNIDFEEKKNGDIKIV